ATLEITHATSAGKSAFAQASISACKLLPRPEMSTPTFARVVMHHPNACMHSPQPPPCGEVEIAQRFRVGVYAMRRCPHPKNAKGVFRPPHKGEAKLWSRLL